MYKNIIRPALFALSQGDNEVAHLIVKRVAHVVERVPLLLRLIEFTYAAHTNPRPVKLFGTTFPNRIGVAAGMDKDGEMLLFLQALGFGFIEIGSVLPFPQTGNPRPRMFRLEEHGALINRMGFNSAGVHAVRNNLSEVIPHLNVPLIVSLGKMKQTLLADTAKDYALVMSGLDRYADAWGVNVSSPNTPDLRKLQGKKYLENLVRETVLESKEMGRQPVLVKIAPDLSEAEVEETYIAAMAGGATGFIVSNTTTTRPLPDPISLRTGEQGGLSGKPLFPLMIEKLRQIRRLDTKVPVITVGGINTRDCGRQAFEEGADLIQILAGLVYEGPRLVQELRSLH